MNFEKHLLIDGSNVLHAWPELHALLARDRDAARARLLQAVQAIHDTEQIRVTTVFDGRGPELTVEQPSREATFVSLFTPDGVTADEVIEHMVAHSVSPSACTVATDDRAERQTIEALGASSLSAADLAAWVSRVEARQRAQVSGLRRRNNQEWRRNNS